MTTRPPAAYQIEFCQQQLDRWMLEYAKRALSWMTDSSVYRQIDDMLGQLQLVIAGQVDYEAAYKICDECVALENAVRAFTYTYFVDHIADPRPLREVYPQDADWMIEHARERLSSVIDCQRKRRGRQRHSSSLEHAAALLTAWLRNESGSYRDWLKATDAADAAIMEWIDIQIE